MDRPVKNAAELTIVATQYLHELNDPKDVKLADARFNGVGKIINIQKARLEYFALRKEAPNIPFLSATA